MPPESDLKDGSSAPISRTGGGHGRLKIILEGDEGRLPEGDEGSSSAKKLSGLANPNLNSNGSCTPSLRKMFQQSSQVMIYPNQELLLDNKLQDEWHRRNDYTASLLLPKN